MSNEPTPINKVPRLGEISKAPQDLQPNCPFCKVPIKAFTPVFKELPVPGSLLMTLICENPDCHALLGFQVVPAFMVVPTELPGFDMADVPGGPLSGGGILDVLSRIRNQRKG